MLKEIAGTYTGKPDSLFRFSGPEEAITAKRMSGDYRVIPTYPRSGSQPLSELEETASVLLNANNGHFFYVNSGMSAVVMLTETTFPTKGDVIICSPKIYGRTGMYLDKFLGNRGVKTVRFDSLEPEKMEDQVRSIVNDNRGSKVKAVWIEVVGNGLGMPVADVEGILNLGVWQEAEELEDTRLFFDNTLATNVVIPVADYLRRYPKVKAAQGDSMTKFAERNLALGGFVVAYNPDVGKALWEHRTVLGYTPDANSANASLYHLKEISEGFREHVLVAAANTARLAEAVAEVAGDRLIVTYPGLNNHPDHELATKWHPQGSIAPVVFIAPTPDASITVEDLYRSLDRHGAFREMQHTDSFGFLMAGVYYNNSDPSLRLAGGQETPETVSRQGEQLQKAIVELFKE